MIKLEFKVVQVNKLSDMFDVLQDIGYPYKIERNETNLILKFRIGQNLETIAIQIKPVAVYFNMTKGRFFKFLKTLLNEVNLG